MNERKTHHLVEKIRSREERRHTVVKMSVYYNYGHVRKAIGL